MTYERSCKHEGDWEPLAMVHVAGGGVNVRFGNGP